MTGFFPPSDSSSVSVQPTPAPAGTPGFFTEASLTTPATILSADFLNGLINEYLTLSTAGGLALNASAPTMTQNIINLIALELGGYVKKIGDTMSGNLTLGTNYGGNNATPSLVVESGSSSFNVIMNAPATTINTVTQAGDTVLYYTDGTQNTGALVLAPYGTGATGGLRMDATGQVTFTRPLTASGGVALSGTSTAPTRPLNDNTTNIATTAFVAGQAATVAPVMDSVATIGSSLTFARQDHVHPTDTSRQPLLGFTPVQQNGGSGMGSNKVYLGYNPDGQVTVQVDSTPFGGIGFLTGSQTWTGNNYWNDAMTCASTMSGSGLYSSGVVNAAGGITGASVYSTGTIAAAGEISSSSVMYAAGSITAGDGIASYGGDITANSGRLRATYGATWAGADSVTAALQGDFYLQPGGAMQFPAYDSYAGYGTGFIIQWMRVNLGPGQIVLNTPIAFPHGILGVVCSYGGNLPPSQYTVGADAYGASQIIVMSWGPALYGVNILMVGY